MPRGRSEHPAATTGTSLPPGAATVADRYVLLRALGAGGMGRVFLARDQQTGEPVALKQLTRVDAKSVLRFKREFRSLAHIQHPNLVRLYDLEREPDGMWYLSMEYVPGTDLVSYLRPEGALAPDWRTDSARVVDCFCQLARGVIALHDAGMLHRDLKPSNVLVAEQRVLVLDFGLVRGIDANDARLTEEGMVSGTPAYMAPEQACAQRLTTAADWYAFGAMLYEVLTGELPFEGSALQILRHKVEREPTPIAELEPGAPRELAELCSALLQRDPAQRPSGAEILERLGAAPCASTIVDGETTSLLDLRPSAPHFVGRAESLSLLARAFGEVERGQTVAVHVQGRSGAGKSALIEHFLTAVEAHAASPTEDKVLVLRSRCYEREAMPFKALDGVMDALAMDLARRDDLDVAHLLPADIQALAQLFPALGHVHSVKRLIGLQRVQTQARTHRQRAEAALHELFGRLARSQPLIVWVDDLHWGDLDSVSILRAWLEQSSHAPFLLLLSYRSDEVDTSPALRALLAPSEAGRARATEHQLEVGPLTHPDLRALCSARLGARALGCDALIDNIVQEANGNPFLASQLASLALARIERGEAGLQSLSMHDLVEQIRALLTPEAASMLAVLSVAGRPMSPKLALGVAGVPHGGHTVLHALRSLRLVRTRDSDAERLVEIYHDGIREHVFGILSADAISAIHQGLLRALAQSERDDPDWLHSLALGAGDRALALRYGLSAAERAQGTLAFERAAELYTRCLDLCEAGAKERGSLWRKLGIVLGHAGRGRRAAEALLEAAQLCESSSEKHELTCMAASHLVRSGQFERGDALFEEIMAAADIRAPRTDGKIVATVAWERMRLGVRGMSYKRRSIEHVSPAALARIDLLEELRVGTTLHDPLRSALFATQSLRLALDAGEPTRIARAMCTAATVEGMQRGAEAARDLLARTAALVDEIGTVRERIELNVARAAVSLNACNFVEVLEPTAEVASALRESALDSSHTYFNKFAGLALRVAALWHLDWRRFREEFLEARREALATENVLALLLLALDEFYSDELAGQPEASVARLEAQREQLPRGRVSVLHVLHMTAVMNAACATGKLDWGFERVEGFWDAFTRSPLHRSAGLRAQAYPARARLLLCHYVRTRSDASLLRQALHDAKQLRRTDSLKAGSLYARVAFLHGDHERALALFSQSAEESYKRGHEPDELRDRCAIGLITGGPQGERMAQAAFDAMEQKFGCVDARRYMRAYLPELLGPV